MLGSMQETYASDGSSQGSVSFNINNASAVQTLEVQFSPNGRIQPPCPVEILFYHGM